MVAKLFLDGIFGINPESNDSPSAVFITMPNVPDSSFCGTQIITGLMVNDPTWTSANSWGPVISDLSNLQDWASLIGSQSQVSWINASTMCWKGTAPLNLSFEFYLINYAQDLGLEDKLTMLNKLTAIDRAPGKEGISGNFLVNVHGGYAADILTGNNALYDRKKDINDLMKGKQGEALDYLNSFDSKLFAGGYASGAVSVRFGHKATINNLLISKLNVTASTVEVANQDGTNPKPLYYKVSIALTGVRPLITSEVGSIYGKPFSGGGSTGATAQASKPANVNPAVQQVQQIAAEHPILSKVALYTAPLWGPTVAPLAASTVVGVKGYNWLKNKFIQK